MHEQLVGGAIIKRVVRADPTAWRKAKGVIDVPFSGA